MFKKGYELYFNRTTFRVDPKIHSQILDLKSEMNKG